MFLWWWNNHKVLCTLSEYKYQNVFKSEHINVYMMMKQPQSVVCYL